MGIAVEHCTSAVAMVSRWIYRRPLYLLSS